MTARRELVCVLTIMALLTLEMGHIAHSPPELQLFTYNADSLTLPLLRESIGRHELIYPVMSTQLLVFPEAVLYALSSLLTTSLRASLVMNAYVNMVVLYVLLRCVAHFATARGRTAERAGAVACCLLFVWMMLLEDTASDLTATYFLFSTYYSGVVLGAVFSLAVVLWQERYCSSRVNANVVVGLCSVAVTGVLAVSDALFFAEVSVPIMTTIGALVLLRMVTPRLALRLGTTQVLGAALGYALRRPLHRFFGISNYNTYIHRDLMWASLCTIGSTVRAVCATPSGLVEVGMLSVALLWAVALTGRCLFRYRRSGRPPTATGFLAVFALLSPLATVGSVVATGNSALRYLIPVTFLPLVSVLPTVDWRLWSAVGRLPRLTHWIPAAAVVAVTTAGSVLLGPLVRSTPTADALCLDAALGGTAADGVGGYWTSRPLDLYNSYGDRIVQVNSDVLPFLWLVNGGEYLDNRFTFVLVDRVGGANRLTARETAVISGRPSSIAQCPDFSVYRYEPGTPGYQSLNDRIAHSARLEIGGPRS